MAFCASSGSTRVTSSCSGYRLATERRLSNAASAGSNSRCLPGSTHVEALTRARVKVRKTRSIVSSKTVSLNSARGPIPKRKSFSQLSLGRDGSKVTSVRSPVSRPPSNKRDTQPPRRQSTSPKVPLGGRSSEKKGIVIASVWSSSSLRISGAMNRTYTPRICQDRRRCDLESH